KLLEPIRTSSDLIVDGLTEEIKERFGTEEKILQVLDSLENKPLAQVLTESQQSLITIEDRLNQQIETMSLLLDRLIDVYFPSSGSYGVGTVFNWAKTRLIGTSRYRQAHFKEVIAKLAVDFFKQNNLNQSLMLRIITTVTKN